MPKSKQRVYVICENTNSVGQINRFQTMAEYIPYMTVKECDFMADEFQLIGDYNEKEDVYYTPEGFYEWSREADICYQLSVPVTHWMPLFNLNKNWNY